MDGGSEVADLKAQLQAYKRECDQWAKAWETKCAENLALQQQIAAKYQEMLKDEEVAGLRQAVRELSRALDEKTKSFDVARDALREIYEVYSDYLDKA